MNLRSIVALGALVASLAVPSIASAQQYPREGRDGWRDGAAYVPYAPPVYNNSYATTGYTYYPAPVYGSYATPVYSAYAAPVARGGWDRDNGRGWIRDGGRRGWGRDGAERGAWR